MSVNTFTIKKIRKKAQHINIWHAIKYSDPSNQKLTDIGIQDIHTLPQQWNKLFDAEERRSPKEI